MSKGGSLRHTHTVVTLKAIYLLRWARFALPTLPSYRATIAQSSALHPGRDDVTVLAKVVAKPDGVAFRPAYQIIGKFREPHPFPLRYLGRIRCDRSLIGASKYVDDLVLDVAVRNRGPVVSGKQRLDLAVHTHLLGKPSMRCIASRLAGPGMATARVGPQPAGMIFLRIPAMHQHVAPPVAHQHRKRPMLQPAPMHLDLRCDALRDVICIDKDDRIAIVRSGRKPVQISAPPPH